MSDYTPSTSTVASAGLGGPIAIIVAWIAGIFGLTMTTDVAISFGVIISTAVGYFFCGGKAIHTAPTILPIPSTEVKS